MISLSEIGGLYKSIPANLKDARTKAFADACDRQVRKLLERAERVKVWCAIENVDGKQLDYLAADCRAQFYHSGLEPDVKRNLIENAMCWYMGAGTKQAVEGLVSTVFGDGKIEEWFEYGGKPYYFRVKLVNVEVAHGQDREFRRMLAGVKRVGAQLDKVQYIFWYVAEQLIGYGVCLRMVSAFYPRYNTPPFYLDGSVLLDGTYRLNGYLSGETLDFYPVMLQVIMDANWRTGTAGTQLLFRPEIQLGMDHAAALILRGAACAKAQIISQFFLQGNACAGTQTDNHLTMQGMAAEHMGTGATAQGISDAKMGMAQESVLQISAATGETYGITTDGTLIVEKDLWRLDGNVMLDGSRLLDAEVYTGEI